MYILPASEKINGLIAASRTDSGMTRVINIIYYHKKLSGLPGPSRGFPENGSGPPPEGEPNAARDMRRDGSLCSKTIQVLTQRGAPAGCIHSGGQGCRRGLANAKEEIMHWPDRVNPAETRRNRPLMLMYADAHVTRDHTMLFFPLSSVFRGNRL